MIEHGIAKKRWDDISRAVIKAMWAMGESATRIAAELTRRGLPDGKPAQRNAVIGVIHRHGYESPMSIKNQKGKPKAAPRPKRRRDRKAPEDCIPPERGPILPVPPMEGDAARAFGVACRIFELKADECRWPVDDHKPFMFCAAVAVKDQPYCSIHTQVATRPYTPPVRVPDALAR